MTQTAFPLRTDGMDVMTGANRVRAKPAGPAWNAIAGQQVVIRPSPALAPGTIAFTSAAATGLVFGFAPAMKAVRVDPPVALANE